MGKVETLTSSRAMGVLSGTETCPKRHHGPDINRPTTQQPFTPIKPTNLKLSLRINRLRPSSTLEMVRAVILTLSSTAEALSRSTLIKAWPKTSIIVYDSLIRVIRIPHQSTGKLFWTPCRRPLSLVSQVMTQPQVCGTKNLYGKPSVIAIAARNRNPSAYRTQRQPAQSSQEIRLHSTPSIHRHRLSEGSHATRVWK